MSLASQVSDLATRIATEIKSAVRPRLMPAAGTAGQVLTKTSAANYATSWASPTASGLTLLGGAPTILTANGTWTKNTAAKLIVFELIGGGGGGGSGSRGDASVGRGGGGGGAGGAITKETLSAEQVAASCAYTIGAGGSAGSARTADNSAGGTGGAGGTTSIAINSNLTLRALGGNQASGGSLTGNASPGSQFSSFINSQTPNCPGQSGRNASAAPAITDSGTNGPGGGGGGGGSSTTTSFAGGPGAMSSRLSYGVAPVSAANGGAAAGSGSAGSDGANPYWGAGGGGGGSNVAGAGGAGAAGGVPGGGGGGGGSSLNGFTGGAGGPGGRGEIRIWEFG